MHLFGGGSDTVHVVVRAYQGSADAVLRKPRSDDTVFFFEPIGAEWHDTGAALFEHSMAGDAPRREPGGQHQARAGTGHIIEQRALALVLDARLREQGAIGQMRQRRQQP